MQQSITFSGELDERAIDREVDALNRRLQEAGNIEVNAVGGPGGVGGMGGGVGGGMAGGDGMGLSDIAEGVGGLQGALEARMPKAIGSAGGMAAKAAPVALAGAVGVGMLSAMHGASAAMQTSASILGNAWNRVWRPIGDRVDELFIRDAVESLGDATRQFESTMRSDGLAIASGELTATLAGDAFSGLGSMARNQLRQQASRGPLGQLQSLAGPVGEFGPGMVVGGVAGATGRSPAQVQNAIDQIPTIMENQIPRFQWPELPQWPGWPDVQGEWPGWPNVDAQWPGWPSINAQWPGWPDLNLPGGFWPDLSARSILGTVFPAVRAGQIVSEVFGGADVGGGAIGSIRDRIPGFARGGMVNRRQIVEVGERGPEVIAPFSELRSMMENMDRRRQSADSADVDTSTLESQLNNVERELRRLRSAMDVTVQVGREEIARASQQGQIEDVTDTDPTA